MTDTDGSDENGSEEEKQQLTEEQQAEQASSDFSSGFKKVQKQLGPTTQEVTGDETQAQPGTGEPAQQQDEAQSGQPSDDETARENADLRKRLRRTEGVVGDLKEQITTLTTLIEEKGQPGSEEENEEAAKSAAHNVLKHLKEFEELDEEFSWMAPIKGELEDLRSGFGELSTKLSGLSEAAPQAQAQPQISAEEIIESVTLNLTHPDWKEVTKTDDFRKFMLHGGPGEEDYAKYSTLLAQANEAAQNGLNDKAQEFNKEANEMVLDFRDENPDWWRDKGEKLFAGSAADSIEMLDRFKEITGQAQPATTSATRLRRSLTPSGVRGERPATVLDDSEGLSRGFNKVRKRQQPN